MKQSTFAGSLIRPFTLWVGFLALLLAGGVVGGLIVFTQGLWVTNLTDFIPWGLWITIDLSAIALSAGAFLLCAAVHLLKIKRLEPVARTAVFIGLIGYSMALITLLLDIGRPDRFYHAVIFWNPHSPLWEVTMCITLYFSVLLLETAPIFAEAAWLKNRFPKVSHLMHSLHRLSPVLAIAGLGLSALHQSSLGATYGILKARPIWYKPDMAVLFIASAMAAGPSMTVLVSMLAARLTPRAVVKDELLEQVAYFIGWVLVAVTYLRFWDLMAMEYTFQPGRTEAFEALTHGAFAFNFWVGEILLGLVLPAGLLLTRRTRQIPGVRMLALALVVGGLVAYRWDTTMIGQVVTLTSLPYDLTPRFATYTPSLVEWMAGLGVIGYGMMAVTLGVKYLRVVDHSLGEEHPAEAAAPAPAAVFAAGD